MYLPFKNQKSYHDKQLNKRMDSCLT